VSLASLSLYVVVIFAMTWLAQIGLFGLGLGMGLAHGLFYPAYTAMVLDGCPPAERGRRMSIIQAGLNIGIGLGGIALGWIAAHWGYPVIFQLSSLTLVLAAGLIATDGSRSRRGTQPPVIAPLSELSESTLER
jgi:MFS family permease